MANLTNLSLENAAVTAHQVLLAKRAFGSVFGDDGESSVNIEEKRPREHHRGQAATPNSSWSPSASPTALTTGVSNSTELKFLKYSELAKELSSGR